MRSERALEAKSLILVGLHRLVFRVVYEAAGREVKRVLELVNLVAHLDNVRLLIGQVHDYGCVGRRELDQVHVVVMHLRYLSLSDG